MIPANSAPVGVTVPVIPDDEEPLDEATLQRFLSLMGTDMVLVGGQALGYWMDRFDISPTGMVISNDGDALRSIIGGVDRAKQIATALHAALVVPDRKALTSLIAQIRIRTPSGKAKNIDILHLLFTVNGLKSSGQFTRQVIRRSIKVELIPGVEIRVMHPLDLLESRMHNAAGLVSEKGPHVITQARWAIQVARKAVLRSLGSKQGGRDRVGAMLQFIYKLAHSQAGRRVLKDHGLEVLQSIPAEEIRNAGPVFDLQLANIVAALEKRSIGITPEPLMPIDRPRG